MRRSLLMIALCACASSGGSEETAGRQPVLLAGKEGTLLGESAAATAVSVAVSPALALRAVRKVYADLEIPITYENPATHEVGNPSFFRTGRLAGEPMQRFVDCGTTVAGPRAASYRIYISLLTDIIPDGKGGTNIKSTLIPVAQDMSGGSGDRITCSSSGRFEAQLLAKVQAAIAKP